MEIEMIKNRTNNEIWNNNESNDYYWKGNEFILFYQNYKTNYNFLNIFFKHYKNMNGENNFLKIENKFLKMIIELEDEYNIIKFMKKSNLDYKKLLVEFS